MAELSQTNIKVMVVYPGGVGTNIMENSGVKMSQRMIANEFRLELILKSSML